MINLFYDSYRILNKVYSEGAFLKQAMSSVQIEEKNRAAVTKCCYGVLEKDILLSKYLSCLCEKSPKLVVRTILKISMYQIKFLSKAPYAVTDSAVELCNKLGKRGVSGFVNAFLRKFIGYELPEAKSEAERLSLKYDYPVFAVNRLIADYGKDIAEQIMSAPAEKTCVRFDGSVNGEEYLTQKGFSFVKTPYDNVFIVDRFTRNADYDKGVYTFQSIGSISICDAVDGGNLLLDACAAPGGKSVLLSERFNGVTSQELHDHRAELISEYAKRMHRDNVCAVVGDATVYNPDYCKVFDTVLCDVPCSGFGVMMSNPDIKLKKSDDTVCELADLQYKILANCAGYVKEGGSLVYSTCSFFKEENDRVVSRFLKDNEQFTLDVITPKIPCIKTEFGVQYLPNISFGAGFYVCKIRRA